MEPLLTVAFVVTATQFFKTQFSLANRYALLCAFIVALIVAFAPIVADQFPAASPYLNAFANVIALFIAGAGSYDLATALIDKSKQKKAPAPWDQPSERQASVGYPGDMSRREPKPEK
jgi:hypothetical protein